MANDILGLVSEQNRPFWCEVYALLQARREGWVCYSMSVPIAIRVIECGGFRCSAFDLVETITAVLDKRIQVLGEAPPPTAQIVTFNDATVSRVLGRIAGETHNILRRYYPFSESGLAS